jgi:hypothetical protein
MSAVYDLRDDSESDAAADVATARASTMSASGAATPADARSHLDERVIVPPDLGPARFADSRQSVP